MTICRKIQKVRKTDMIMMNDNRLEFRGGGRFLTDLEWIHPEKTEVTYELIYVTDGEVFLEIERQPFHLSAKDLIILPPGIVHRGYASSHGRTSFYWIHFCVDDLAEFAMAGTIYRSFSNSFLLKELLHFQNSPACTPVMLDIVLSHILVQIAYDTVVNFPPPMALFIFINTMKKYHPAGIVTPTPRCI